LPNSTGQFAKFRSSSRQNCPNSAAYRGLPFVHKLSFIPLQKNFSFWMLAWRSVMLATYKENYQFFFFSDVQFAIVFIYDCAVYDGNY